MRRAAGPSGEEHDGGAVGVHEVGLRHGGEERLVVLVEEGAHVEVEGQHRPHGLLPLGDADRGDLVRGGVGHPEGAHGHGRELRGVIEPCTVCADSHGPPAVHRG